MATDARDLARGDLSPRARRRSAAVHRHQLWTKRPDDLYSCGDGRDPFVLSVWRRAVYEFRANHLVREHGGFTLQRVDTRVESPAVARPVASCLLYPRQGDR